MKITSTSDTGNSVLSASGAAAAVNSSTTFVHDFSEFHSPGQLHTQAVVTIGGSGGVTFTGAALLIEVLSAGGLAWTVPLVRVRGTGVQSAGTDSPADSTAKSYLVDIRGAKKLRVSNSSGTITAMGVEVATGVDSEFGGPFGNINTITAASFSAGETFTGGTGVNLVTVPDNLADAWSVTEGSNKYLTVITTDSSEAVKLWKNVTLVDGKTVTNSANTTGTSIWGASDKGGFFGVTPVVRQAAITQTYSTTASTVPADTSHTITDSTGGSASTSALVVQTLPTSPGSGADGTTPNGAQWTAAVTQLTVIKNSITTLAAELALAKADALATKKVLNLVIDYLQAYGLAQ